MEKISFVELTRDRWSVFTIICFLLILISQIVIMATTELSYDESYYWIYSQYLSWGYYDHPPMAAWSIFLGNSIFGHNEFAVRFLPLVYLIGTVVLMSKLCRGKNLGYLYALILSMPLITLSGLASLPDSPLMFFTTAFFYLVKKYLDEDSIKISALLALVISCMFYSKYHGLLIVILTVIGNPEFFKRKSFWAIVAAVICLYMPHMYWQYKNEFISFKFHLFGRNEKHFDIKNIFDYFFGQVVLMGFLLFPLGVLISIKNKSKDNFEKILKVNSFGFLIFLLVMSFRNQIEANWTISSAVALAIYMSFYVEKYKKYFWTGFVINLFLCAFLRVILLNIGAFVEEGEESRLNELYGWKIRQEKVINICKDQKIVGDNYQITSKLAFYTGNSKIPSLHLGSRESHYSIIKLERQLKRDEMFCYLTSKNIMGAKKVDTNYKDPIYVIPNTNLNKLIEFYGIDYEEIIRKRI